MEVSQISFQFNSKFSEKVDILAYMYSVIQFMEARSLNSIISIKRYNIIDCLYDIKISVGP